MRKTSNQYRVEPASTLAFTGQGERACVDTGLSPWLMALESIPLPGNANAAEGRSPMIDRFT